MSQQMPPDANGAAGTAPPAKYLTVRQAAFIGVGAMVGAGIFALLGAAGEVAGAVALMARKLGGRASAGLLIQAAACLILAVVFKLDAIASIGSAVALLIFTLITAATSGSVPRPVRAPRSWRSRSQRPAWSW